MQSVRGGPSDGFHAATMGATVVLLLSVLLLTPAVVLKLFQWRVVKTTLCKRMIILIFSFCEDILLSRSAICMRERSLIYRQLNLVTLLKICEAMESSTTSEDSSKT